MVAWIPPEAWAERALGPEPGGGLPSVRFVQHPSNPQLWSGALVLTIGAGQACPLSIGRACALLAEQEKWEDYTGAAFEPAPNAPPGSVRLASLDNIEAYGPGDQKQCPWWYRTDTLKPGMTRSESLAMVLMARIGGEVVVTP